MYLPDGTVRKQRETFNEENHAHELTFCCYHRLPLLSRDRSRLWLIDALAKARERWSFELWAYAIMPEHVHLLIYPTTREYDIANILKGIKQPVARSAVNYWKRTAPDRLEQLRVRRTTGRVEHRFWQQGGGFDRNVYNAKTAWACVEYIHANPVRRGLANTPVDWPWSSARWYEGLDDVILPMDDAPETP